MSIEKKLPLEQVLMDTIKDMVFIMKIGKDNSFYYDFINQAVLERTRLNQKVLGKSFYEVYSVEKARFLSEHYKKVVESLESHSYEDSRLSFSGEKNYYRIKLTPILEQDHLSHIVAVVKDITEEKSAESNIKGFLEKINESERRYHSLFYYNPEAIFSLDLDGHILTGNSAVVDVTGYSVKQLINKDFTKLIVSENAELVKKQFIKVLEGTNVQYETVIINKLGNHVDVSMTFTPIIINNNVIGVYAILKDISKMMELLSDLSHSERRYRFITENIHDLITVIDGKGNIIYASPSYKNILGFDPKEYEGELFFYNIHREDVNILEQTFTESMISGQPCKLKLKQFHKTKGWLWFELHGTPVYDDFGQFAHMVFVSRDISLQKRYEAKLKQLAFYDSLTDLPNRRLLKKHLRKALKSFKKKQEKMAVIMMDIDNFKNINDQYGHDIGDDVIKEFGNRINNSIGDADLVARFGGDEFTILLPNIESTDIIIPLVEKIQKSIEASWNINDNCFEVTTSIGIAIVNSLMEDENESELIKAADSALYEAKESGKNNYKIKIL